jgi:fibronectin-binding autotransporter adhesin
MLPRFDVSIGSLAGAAGATVSLGAHPLAVGGNNTSTTYAGLITGTGGLTK